MNNNQCRLSGAKFGVYNEGGSKICEGVTNGQGEVTFDNLPVGCYCVRELRAPDGYYPCKDDFLVQITASDHDKCITVLNHRITGKITVLKLGV